MGVLPKQGYPKFKLFNLLSWTHKIFKVNKYYKRKIKFDQILGYQNGRCSPNQAAKIQNFLTTHVRHMTFSELIII